MVLETNGLPAARGTAAAVDRQFCDKLDIENLESRTNIIIIKK